MSPGVDRRQIVLCSRCRTHIGYVLMDGGLRLRRRDGWTTLPADFPSDGLAEAWCDGCGKPGNIDVDLVRREAYGRRPIRARLRRVDLW